MTELDFSDSFVDEHFATDEQDEPLRVVPAERKLVTQPYDYSVETLAQRVDSGKLVLDIDYQRNYVWDTAKASRLIESLLMNVPVPVCYFAEIDGSNHEVIDGLQRITAISSYMKDGYPLKGLSVLTELLNKRFSELPPRAQRQLENRTVRCIVITEESHPDIKFDVFERLNTGSVRLSAQELRNCIYRGPLNESLKEISEDDKFRRILGSSQNRRMDHEELALRFFAVQEAIEDYRPPLRQVLSEYMRRNRQSPISGPSREHFLSVCEAIYEVFGSSAFLMTGQDGKVHNPVNKALFDAMMIPASKAPLEVYKSRAPQLIAMRDSLLTDDDFLASIGRATADRKRMYARVGAVMQGMIQADIPVTLVFPDDINVRP